MVFFEEVGENSFGVEFYLRQHRILNLAFISFQFRYILFGLDFIGLYWVLFGLDFIGCYLAWTLLDFIGCYFLSSIIAFKVQDGVKYVDAVSLSLVGSRRVRGA